MPRDSELRFTITADNQIEAPLQTIKAGFEDVNQSARGVISALSGLAAELQNTGQIAETDTAGLTAQLDAARESSAALSDSLGTILSALQGSGESVSSVQQIQESFAGIESQIATLVAVTAALGDSLREALTNSGAGTAELTDSLTALQETFAALGQTFSDSIGGLQASIDTLRQTFEDLGAGLEEPFQQIRDFNEELATEADSVSEKTEKLSEDIEVVSEAAGETTERLQDLFSETQTGAESTTTAIEGITENLEASTTASEGFGAGFQAAVTDGAEQADKLADSLRALLELIESVKAAAAGLFGDKSEISDNADPALKKISDEFRNIDDQVNADTESVKGFGEELGDQADASTEHTDKIAAGLDGVGQSASLAGEAFKAMFETLKEQGEQAKTVFEELRETIESNREAMTGLVGELKSLREPGGGRPGNSSGGWFGGSSGGSSSGPSDSTAKIIEKGNDTTARAIRENSELLKQLLQETKNRANTGADLSRVRMQMDAYDRARSLAAARSESPGGWEGLDRYFDKYTRANEVAMNYAWRSFWEGDSFWQSFKTYWIVRSQTLQGEQQGEREVELRKKPVEPVRVVISVQDIQGKLTTSATRADTAPKAGIRETVSKQAGNLGEAAEGIVLAVQDASTVLGPLYNTLSEKLSSVGKAIKDYFTEPLDLEKLKVPDQIAPGLVKQTGEQPVAAASMAAPLEWFAEKMMEKVPWSNMGVLQPVADFWAQERVDRDRSKKQEPTSPGLLDSMRPYAYRAGLVAQAAGARLSEPIPEAKRIREQAISDVAETVDSAADVVTKPFRAASDYLSASINSVASKVTIAAAAVPAVVGHVVEPTVKSVQEDISPLTSTYGPVIRNIGGAVSEWGTNVKDFMRETKLLSDNMGKIAEDTGRIATKTAETAKDATKTATTAASTTSDKLYWRAATAEYGYDNPNAVKPEPQKPEAAPGWLDSLPLVEMIKSRSRAAAAEEEDAAKERMRLSYQQYSPTKESTKQLEEWKAAAKELEELKNKTFLSIRPGQTTDQAIAANGSPELMAANEKVKKLQAKFQESGAFFGSQAAEMLSSGATRNMTWRQTTRESQRQINALEEATIKLVQAMREKNIVVQEGQTVAQATMSSGDRELIGEQKRIDQIKSNIALLQQRKKELNAQSPLLVPTVDPNKARKDEAKELLLDWDAYKTKVDAAAKARQAEQPQLQTSSTKLNQETTKAMAAAEAEWSKFGNKLQTTPTEAHKAFGTFFAALSGNAGKVVDFLTESFNKLGHSLAAAGSSKEIGVLTESFKKLGEIGKTELESLSQKTESVILRLRSELQQVKAQIETTKREHANEGLQITGSTDDALREIRRRNMTEDQKELEAQRHVIATMSEAKQLANAAMQSDNLTAEDKANIKRAQQMYMKALAEAKTFTDDQVATTAIQTAGGSASRLNQWLGDYEQGQLRQKQQNIEGEQAQVEGLKKTIDDAKAALEQKVALQIDTAEAQQKVAEIQEQIRETQVAKVMPLLDQDALNDIKKQLGRPVIMPVIAQPSRGDSLSDTTETWGVGLRPPGIATGGPIPGFGGGDSVHALLEPGEFVINKDSARSLGPGVLDLLNRSGQNALPTVTGALQRFAAGGSVGVLASNPSMSIIDLITDMLRPKLEEFGRSVASFATKAQSAGDRINSVVVAANTRSDRKSDLFDDMGWNDKEGLNDWKETVADARAVRTAGLVKPGPWQTGGFENFESWFPQANVDRLTKARSDRKSDLFDDMGWNDKESLNDWKETVADARAVRTAGLVKPGPWQTGGFENFESWFPQADVDRLTKARSDKEFNRIRYGEGEITQELTDLYDSITKPSETLRDMRNRNDRAFESVGEDSGNQLAKDAIKIDSAAEKFSKAMADKIQIEVQVTENGSSGSIRRY